MKKKAMNSPLVLKKSSYRHLLLALFEVEAGEEETDTELLEPPKPDRESTIVEADAEFGVLIVFT